MPQRSGRPTRERIVDAAEQLMRSIGLARATTKEIASAAGCSEAALYKHFASKEELFIAVLQERLPPLGPLLAEFAEDPSPLGTEECLLDVARKAVVFYQASVPITASLFAEPSLLRRHRAALRELGVGPQTPVEALAGFLRAEQKRGRVRADADPEAAALALLGGCLQRAFLTHFWASAEPAEELDAFTANLVRTIARGITTE